MLLAIGYLGSRIYIDRNLQRAAVTTGDENSFTGGSLDTRNWPQKESITFTVESSRPLESAVLLKGQLIPASTVTNGVTVDVTTEQLTLGSSKTKYSLTVPPKILVGTYTFKVDGGGDLVWVFPETIEITAAKEVLNLPYLTPTANEARITGFSISLDKPGDKIPGAYKLTWSGGGRGIALHELKGIGAHTIKQLKYENIYPIENSGYKDVPPFYVLPGDGVGETGSANVYLINPATKELAVEAVFVPKGEDGAISPNYARTIKISVPPSAPKIVGLSPRVPRAGDEVVVYMATPVPIAQFTGTLKTDPYTQLRFLKNTKNGSDIVIDSVRFTMENTMTFVVPKNILPGKYKLSLKSPLGATVFPVQIAK